MEIIFTDGLDERFTALCGELDDFLDSIAETHENRARHIPYNNTASIRDVALAIENGRVIGCGSIRRFSDDATEIKRMFVRPAHRKSGAGRAIIEALIKRAKAQGYRRIILETNIALADAVRLYSSAGFFKTEPYGPYIDMPEAYCMAKDI